MSRRYPQDRELYPNEIARTDQSNYLIDRGGEQPTTCRYCFNDDTQQVIGYALKPFAEYYGPRRFKAFSCYCCGAVWSYSLPTPQPQRNLALYGFTVVVGMEISAIKTQLAYHQWLCGHHNEFYSEWIAAYNAESVRQGTLRSAQALQTRHDEWASARYFWWGSAEEPWYRERRGLPPTSSPLNSRMNPERVQWFHHPA